MRILISKDICNPVFMTALFILSKPLNPHMKEERRHGVCAYIYILQNSSIKRERNSAIFNNMDGPRGCYIY